MKLKFIFFESKTPEWVENARQEYVGKLKPFFPTEIQLLKSPRLERENAEEKQKKEAELLFKAIDAKDLLILLDEAGKAFPSSDEFAKHLLRQLESGRPRLVFCVGGAYGFAASVKERSHARWSLSALTFNHWLAQIITLEQVFRALTILRGIPYHNN